MGLLEKDKVFTDRQSSAMRALCKEMSIPAPPKFTLVPMNFPAVLIHWRPLVLLCAQLNQHHREMFREKFHEAARELSSAPSVPPRSSDEKLPATQFRVILPDPQFPSAGEASGSTSVQTPTSVEAFDRHFHFDRTVMRLELPSPAPFRTYAIPLSPLVNTLSIW